MSITSGAYSEAVEVYIDSKQRNTGGTPENFTLTLGKPLKKVMRIEPIEMEIPFTYYTTNANNNVLKFDVGGTVYTATVSPASYVPNTFMTALQDAMNAAYFPAGFTITYSGDTFKFTINNATAFKILYAGSTIARSIGIFADTAVGTSITTGMINIGGTKNIFIKSVRLLKPKVNRPLFLNQPDNILYKLPVDGLPGDILIDKNNHRNTIDYAILQTLETIDFQLVDEDGIQLDLNGQEWAISLNVIIA
jgi:hypothetical protein